MAHGDSAHDLFRIHAVITRGLENALAHGRRFAAGGEGDRGAYATYLRTWLPIVHSHHDTEEQLVFPVLVERWPEGPTEQLREEHHALAAAMDAIDAHVKGLAAGASDAAFAALVPPLERFEALWRPHIAQEEEAFTPVLVRRIVSPAEEARLSQQAAAHGRKHSGPGPLALPFILYNLAPDERPGFEAHLPWIVKRVLVPLVWKRTWRPLKPFLSYPPA